MGNTARSGAGLRVAAPLLLTAAILVGTGVWIDDEHTDEAEAFWIVRCEDTQLPLLTDYLIRAYVDGDFEAVWEMLSWRRKYSFEMMSEGHGDAGDYWWSVAESVGLERSELTGREPGEIFVALQRALAESHPEEWWRQMDALQNLGRPILLPGRHENYDRGVEYQPRPGDLTAIRFLYVHRGGRWSLALGFQRTLRTLARKVAVFLPKKPFSEQSEPPAIAILEVGQDRLDEEQVARLAEHIETWLMRFDGNLAVVLELSAELPMADVLPAIDAPHFGHCHWICIADTTTNGRPPPGIRVNGVDLDDLDELPPVPEDHPALDRIIMSRRE